MGPAGSDGRCTGLWADAKTATCPNLKDFFPPRTSIDTGKEAFVGTPGSVHLLSKDMIQVILCGSGPPETH